MDTAMDNNQAVERRRTAQASRPPMEVLSQLPALVLLERIPVPTLAVLQDGTIVFANTAFADMVGRDAEEVVALRFHDIFHGALETESVLSVVDGLANMVVELAHQDGSTVRALMSRSAPRRTTRSRWQRSRTSPKSSGPTSTSRCRSQEASCSTWRSASRARNSR